MLSTKLLEMLGLMWKKTKILTERTDMVGKFFKELKRRLFETHYRIVEIERFKSGVKWYYVQRLGLFGWTAVKDIYATVEQARKALEYEKNKYVVDTKVVEEL